MQIIALVIPWKTFYKLGQNLSHFTNKSVGTGSSNTKYKNSLNQTKRSKRNL